jgi:aldehyde:ferredoxin oxidoreductase
MIDIAEFYSAFEGVEVTKEQIGDLAWQVLEDEWKFNELAGWKAEDDVLSDDMVNEGIGPDGVFKFDVGADTIAAAKVRFEPRDELYNARASG